MQGQGLGGRGGERWRRPGAVAAVVLLGACGTGDATREDGPVVVGPDEVRVLGTPDGLARVLDVQPAADGRIWVLNSVEPFFVVVAADGNAERAFGSPGGGPREYGAPVGLVRGPGPGEIWTYDVPRHALRRIAPEAGRDLSLPADTLAPARLVSFHGAGFRPARPWMARARDGILVASGRPSTPPWTGIRLWASDIFLVRTGGPGRVLEARHAIADLLGDPASRYPRATRFLPYPIWALCDDGGLRLYDPLGNSIRRFDRHGVEQEALPLPAERRLAITFDRLFGMAYLQYREEAGSLQASDSAQLRGALEAQFPQLAATSADVFPEYADLRCTGEGTMWLQPFDPASVGLGHGREWWRIEEDGSRTIYRLPRAFTAFRFARDRIWGTVVDSLGVPSVGWIDVRH